MAAQGRNAERQYGSCGVRALTQGRLSASMKMSWVTLDRICAEEMLSDEKIRRLVEGGNRPLRSRAGHLSDEELLDKLRGFGLDLDRRSLERLCEGCPSTSFLTPCGQRRLRLLRDRCEQPRWGAMQPAPAGAGRSSKSAAAHPGRPVIATELRSSWLRASRRNDAVPSGPGHPFHAQVDVGSSTLPR
jgi:hypothetical protein